MIVAPVFFLQPICAGNLPACLAANAIVAIGTAGWQGYIRRRRARARVCESATGRLPHEVEYLEDVEAIFHDANSQTMLQETDSTTNVRASDNHIPELALAETSELAAVENRAGELEHDPFGNQLAVERSFIVVDLSIEAEQTFSEQESAVVIQYGEDKGAISRHVEERAPAETPRAPADTQDHAETSDYSRAVVLAAVPDRGIVTEAIGNPLSREWRESDPLRQSFDSDIERESSVISTFVLVVLATILVLVLSHRRAPVHRSQPHALSDATPRKVAVTGAESGGLEAAEQCDPYQGTEKLASESMARVIHTRPPWLAVDAVEVVVPTVIGGADDLVAEFRAFAAYSRLPMMNAGGARWYREKEASTVLYRRRLEGRDTVAPPESTMVGGVMAPGRTQDDPAHRYSLTRSAGEPRRPAAVLWRIVHADVNRQGGRWPLANTGKGTLMVRPLAVDVLIKIDSSGVDEATEVLRTFSDFVRRAGGTFLVDVGWSAGLFGSLRVVLHVHGTNEEGRAIAESQESAAFDGGFTPGTVRDRSARSYPLARGTTKPGRSVGVLWRMMHADISGQGNQSPLASAGSGTLILHPAAVDVLLEVNAAGVEKTIKFLCTLSDFVRGVGGSITVEEGWAIGAFGSLRVMLNVCGVNDEDQDALMPQKSGALDGEMDPGIARGCSAPRFSSVRMPGEQTKPGGMLWRIIPADISGQGGLCPLSNPRPGVLLVRPAAADVLLRVNLTGVDQTAMVLGTFFDFLQKVGGAITLGNGWAAGTFGSLRVVLHVCDTNEEASSVDAELFQDDGTSAPLEPAGNIMEALPAPSMSRESNSGTCRPAWACAEEEPISELDVSEVKQPARVAVEAGVAEPDGAESAPESSAPAQEEVQHATQYKNMVAVRVRYEPEDKDVLDVFLNFFRKMFGGVFDIGVEPSVVLITGQGKGNMPLKTARCLDHALRICREEGFQPADFSLIRARTAISGEDTQGHGSRYIVSGIVPGGPALGNLAAVHSIVVDKVEPETLSFPVPSPARSATGSGGSGASIEEPKPEVDGALSSLPPLHHVPSWPNTGDYVKVMQLWGLTHCVTPAFERLLAMKSSWSEQSFTLGTDIICRLKREAPLRHKSARVRLDDVLGRLTIEGNPTDADRLFHIVVNSLSLELPDSVATVDLVHSGAMRCLTTASALRVTADDAGIPFDLVVFVPWWQKMRMVVVVPDVGAVPGALTKVCSALDRRVQSLSRRSVSVSLWPALIHAAADATNCKHEAGKKDLEYAFVASVSNAVGTNLWLDGFHLRGLVAEDAEQEAAQAKLLVEKTKLVAQYDLKEPKAWEPTTTKAAGSLWSLSRTGTATSLPHSRGFGVLPRDSENGYEHQHQLQHQLDYGQQHHQQLQQQQQQLQLQHLQQCVQQQQWTPQQRTSPLYPQQQEQQEQEQQRYGRHQPEKHRQCHQQPRHYQQQYHHLQNYNQQQQHPYHQQSCRQVAGTGTAALPLFHVGHIFPGSALPGGDEPSARLAGGAYSHPTHPTRADGSVGGEKQFLAPCTAPVTEQELHQGIVHPSSQYTPADGYVQSGSRAAAGEHRYTSEYTAHTNVYTPPFLVEEYVNIGHAHTTASYIDSGHGGYMQGQGGIGPDGGSGGGHSGSSWYAA